MYWLDPRLFVGTNVHGGEVGCSKLSIENLVLDSSITRQRCSQCVSVCDATELTRMSQTFRVDDDTVSSSKEIGIRMLDLIRELYPIGRSITGPGLRKTVKRLGEIVPLQITEVPSGTKVYDWIVPDEWSIEAAYIEDSRGHRVVDLTESNLHLVGYSVPVDREMTLEELKPHLHSLSAYPDWIPYRTSYYAQDWGFCLTDRVLRSLADGRYRPVIRSELKPGSLTLAEYVHHGLSNEEVLIFAHDCHPSLANDNLSGVAVAINLAAHLRSCTTRYTYRFVFAPATIGSITWLATNEPQLDRIKHGLVLSLLGNSAPLRYKETQSGDLIIDRTAWHVLKTEFPDSTRLDFSPWGYDERQFASPGINLPVGALLRSQSGEYPEYHTSADNLTMLSTDALGESWLACLRIFEALETNARYRNLQPRGEPQLGRRGLYRQLGGYYTHVPDRQMALLWLLNQSDGARSLLDIAERSQIRFNVLADAALDLKRAGLLGTMD
jgi:aminopeptidase-like protein